ncbi:MAG TPA: NADH-quinone oxidoreductase subunit L [Candidatus Kapabacteria bacterium]|jgi:NADH-quinone oxidoreductase subunit L|nr:NADH-quinone oxidoreductase subunit L [Candidatus Kapabacteria bacterium]
MIETLLPFVLLLPLIGFVINGAFGKRIKSEALIATIGTAAVAIPFAMAVVMFLQMLGEPETARRHIVEIAEWITTGTFSAGFYYQVDQLSMIFLLVITGVGSLIHLYSAGYMHGDPGFGRFFAYLNLFIFMMLNLVLADNFLLTFLGWEGVGLCSYLLIGFWYEREFKGVAITWTGDAAKKAFVVNRIGDLGMLIGMFILFNEFGTLRYHEITGIVSSPAAGFFRDSSTAITTATMFLFLGACGKSAQIPLAVWLPDAMAGPTPVSALIHAATMVTSGIFLLARNAALFSLAPTTMMVITVVAIFTAFMAATIGLVQNDIKKILAYSTVSQLGFMFVALGVGAFTAAVFHVMTHAFFKALLFLGSGSVIHGMHHEQDVRHMGGLRKYMPQTYRTYFIGALAISGVPLLSGFFSKDEILANAFGFSPILWGIGVVTAFFTAFYMFRSVYLTFRGEERFDHHHVHPHESPATMTIPLWILAVLSIVGGYVGLPPVLGENVHALGSWLEPVFAPAQRNIVAHHLTHSTEWILMAVSSAIALSGIWLARHFYITRPELPERLAASMKGLHAFLMNKWYLDEFYQTLIVRPLTLLSRSFLYRVVDVRVIDGIINGTGRLTADVSRGVRRLQTGVVQNYVTMFLVGILAIVGWFLLR